MLRSFRLGSADHVARGILQFHLQRAAIRIHREQINAGLTHIVRSHEHSLSAVQQQVKVGIIDFHKVHITVQAAIESKVSILGIHIALGIGDHHSQHVALGQHGGSQIIPESGEAALMGTHIAAVAVNGSHMVGASEFNILLLAGSGLGQIDLIGADAPPVITAAVLAIQSIPGVGQRHRSEGLTFLGK